MADLSKLTDEQLFELKASGGDLTKLTNGTLMALKGVTTPEVKPQGGAESTVASAAKGLTFNFGDEAKAAVHATMPGVIDFLNTPLFESGAKPTNPASRAPTWRERYEENLSGNRAQSAANEKEHPVLTTAGEIGGNVAGLVTAAPKALFSNAGSLTGNVLKGAGVNAGIGAVAGYGAGEGETQRIGNALVSGAYGGAIGAAVPPAAAGGSRLLETGPGRYVSEKIVAPALRTVSSAFGGNAPKGLSAAAADGGIPPSLLDALADKAGNIANNAGLQRLATAVQRSGRSVESLQRDIDRYGVEAVLADLDPQLLSMATGLKVLPGETRTVAKNVLEGRAEGRPQRMVSAFEGSEPPPSTYQLRGEGQAFDQNIAAVGQRVYGAMEEAGLKQTPELMAIYENPEVASAITRIMNAEKRTRIGTDRPPASPVEIMHKVKQAIWDLGFNKDTARPGPDASWYRDLGVRYMDLLKQANPALREADAAYTHAHSLPEYFDLGRNFLRSGTTEAGVESSAPALADKLRGATEQQALAARAGSTTMARDTVSGRGALPKANALARDIDTGAEIKARLVELYGPEEAAKIIQRAQTEKVFLGTENALGAGSQTAEKVANALDMGSVGSGLPSGAPTSVSKLIEYLAAARNWAVNPNETVRNELGRILLSQNAEGNKNALRAVEEILRRRRNPNALRSGIPGVVGSEASGP